MLTMQFVRKGIMSISLLLVGGCASLGSGVDPTNTDECWNLRHILANSRTSYSEEDIRRLRALWNSCELSFERNIEGH